VPTALVDVRPQDEAGEEERQDEQHCRALAFAEELDGDERERDARCRAGDRRGDEDGLDAVATWRPRRQRVHRE
jgi:hypothetical protein